VLSNLPEVHTLAAMGLLWALEKGDYDTYVDACVYWRIKLLNKLRGVSLLDIMQEHGNSDA
jgi:hypothetical protein